MTTPIVTEIPGRPEAVTHDTFIDDLSRTRPAGPRPTG
jgi:hypothetical protein